MSQGQTITEQSAASTNARERHDEDAAELDTGFGAEFRELARQRRFVRSIEHGDWREHAAKPSGNRAARTTDAASVVRDSAPAAPRAQRPVAPAPPQAPTRAMPEPPAMTSVPAAAPAAPAPIEVTPRTTAPATVTRTAAPLPAANVVRRAAADQRISDDQRATLRELARMSDRLVEAREQLVTTNAHVAALKVELTSARADVATSEQRLIASRMLVQDAQRAAHSMAERCASLEARCDTLQDALELAVNASWITRWKWRREHQRATQQQHG